MAEAKEWAFPDEMQPQPGQCGFDLDATINAVVGLRAEIPADGFTAGTLGTERAGSGVVIRDNGLVLTIGYLITEAETIWLSTNTGVVAAGHPLAYDHATGFGIVQALGRLGVRALTRGSAASVSPGDDVLVIGQGGRPHSLRAKVIAKREFAGYWEYVLDEALFTAPAHPQWGGAAVVDTSGKLIGIGSLLVEERVRGNKIQGNMVVPIDLLAPIIDAMLTTGSSGLPPRPWLGLYAAEANDGIVVGGLARRGPAERAGIKEGDRVLEVAGEQIDSLADLFRKVWRVGTAGAEIPLTIVRSGETMRLKLRSADRNDFLKKPRLH